jgi:RNA polymerase sigma factor (sigma-70 family)
MGAVGEAAVEQGLRPAADDEDQCLWHAAAAGDAAAFDALLARHWDRVVSVACRFLNDPNDAADVVQETFVRAYQALHRKPDLPYVRAWLLRVTINCCKKKRRSLWRLDRLVARVGALAAPAEDPRRQVERNLLAGEIEQAVRNLPDDLREPFTLRFFEDLSGAEIALILQWNESTVWTRIYAARRKLRQQFADRLELLDLDSPG